MRVHVRQKRAVPGLCAAAGVQRTEPRVSGSSQGVAGSSGSPLGGPAERPGGVGKRVAAPRTDVRLWKGETAQYLESHIVLFAKTNCEPLPLMLSQSTVPPFHLLTKAVHSSCDLQPFGYQMGESRGTCHLPSAILEMHYFYWSSCFFFFFLLK